MASLQRLVAQAKGVFLLLDLPGGRDVLNEKLFRFSERFVFQF